MATTLKKIEEIQHKYKPDILLSMAKSEKELLKITQAVRPALVVTYYDPRFVSIKIPAVKVKMLRIFEEMIFP